MAVFRSLRSLQAHGGSNRWLKTGCRSASRLGVKMPQVESEIYGTDRQQEEAGLAALVSAGILDPPPDPAYDTITRLARYLGRWIYHSGWYPDRKIRLY